MINLVTSPLPAKKEYDHITWHIQLLGLPFWPTRPQLSSPKYFSGEALVGNILPLHTSCIPKRCRKYIFSSFRRETALLFSWVFLFSFSPVGQ